MSKGEASAALNDLCPSIREKMESPTMGGFDRTLWESLTERQQHVGALIIAGLPDKDIAKRLQIAPGTMRAHSVALFRKCGVNSRSQIIAKLYRIEAPKIAGITFLLDPRETKERAA